MFRRVMVSLMSLMLLAVTTQSLAADSSQSSKLIPLDGIVAVVNDQVITQGELSQAMTAAKMEIEKSGQSMPNQQVLEKQVLNQLVARKLQLQIANKNNLSATDAEVNRAIESIAQQNKMTLAQLKQAISQEGMSFTQFEKQIKQEATIAKLQREAISPMINVTPEEVNNFIKNYHNSAGARTAYHLLDILVALPDSPTSKQVQQAEQKAQAMVDKLRKGANFKQMAIADSDADNALKGGDLGWRTLAGMPTVFADNVQGLQKGAIVGPLRAGNGLHIIKVAGLRNPDSDKITKQSAEQMLFQRKFQEKLQQWLSQLRQQAFIKIENA